MYFKILQRRVGGKAPTSAADGFNQCFLYASRVTPAEAPFPRVLHAHPDLAEVVLITEGTGVFFLDERKQTVSVGDLLVYNANIIHDEMSTPANTVGLYCIGVGGLRMPGLPENTLLPREQGCVFPTGDCFGELRSLYELIFHCLGTEEPRTEAVCHSLMTAILTKALAVAEGGRTVPVESDVLAVRIKAYIDTHFSEPLTLQDIGDALRVSPYYLAHVFRDVYGYAPMKYLTRRRIGEAQTLLLDTDLPVGRVAELVGYETQTHFNAQFVRHTGMPPGRFRQSRRTGVRETESAQARRPAAEGDKAERGSVPQR